MVRKNMKRISKLYLTTRLNWTMLSTIKPVTKLTALTVKKRLSLGLVKKTTTTTTMMMTFFPLFLHEVRRVLREFLITIFSEIILYLVSNIFLLFQTFKIN